MHHARVVLALAAVSAVVAAGVGGPAAASASRSITLTHRAAGDKYDCAFCAEPRRYVNVGADLR